MISRGVYPILTGGVEIHVHYVVRELHKQIDVILIHEGTLSRKPEYSSISAVNKLRISGVLPQLYAFLVSIWLVFRNRIRCDLVHAQTATLPLFTSVIISKLLRVPLIVSCHGAGVRLRGKSIFQRPLKQIALNMAKIITCVSHEILNTLVNEFKLRKDKIYIVPNGYPRLLVRKPRTHVDSSKLLTIANLREEKNPFLLLEAIKAVQKFIPDLSLKWIGEGVLRKKIEEYIISYQLESIVTLLGSLPHKIALDELSKAGVFVMSSKIEGLPTVLIEAMALAKPIVATDVGGIRDILVNKINGILIPPDNPDEMSEALLELHQNPKFAEQLGDEARKSVQDLDWFSISKKYLKLYNKAIPSYKRGKT